MNFGPGRRVATIILLLAGGGLRADDAPIVIVREPGRPQQRCVIEQSQPQADGTTVHIVRDVATGERLRVIDQRINRNGSGPRVGQLLARLGAAGDESMSQALAASPAGAGASRAPTTAELAAGGRAKAGPAAAGGGGENPVAAVLQQLRQGDTPSQREVAAMTLALSDARTIPEVVHALVQAAQDDGAASVRACCVRCLYRISGEVPEVAGSLVAMTSDPVFEVAETARLALRAIDQKPARK